MLGGEKELPALKCYSDVLGTGGFHFASHKNIIPPTQVKMVDVNPHILFLLSIFFFCIHDTSVTR